MTTLQRHPLGATEAILAALHTDGVVIVEDVLEPATLAALNREIDPHLEQADPARRHLSPFLSAFNGPHTRHVASLTAKSPTFASQVLCHPIFSAVCDEMLLPFCTRYQLNLGHVLDRGPGADRQYLHRDEDVWLHLPKPHPEVQVASITALVDFSTENGATVFVPGSHEWDRDRSWTDYSRPAVSDDQLAFAEMRAGSSVIYLGSTLHAGGANNTSVRRRGLHMSFTLGWLRTEENNYLRATPDIVRNLPRQTQELLGYAIHYAVEGGGGYLGMVELSDPIDLMAEGTL